MAEESGEHKPEIKGENGVISLKVKDQHGGEVVFKVKRHTKFEKIFNAYCSKKAMDVAQVKFVFDGHRLQGNQTPDDMEMEDNDTIDAMIEQIGGYCSSLAH